MAKKIESDFLPDYQHALRGKANRFAYFLSLLVAAFFVIFVIWANHAVLDEVTRGEARVVPSSKIQVIQNLEGGIVSELLVTDGQIVQQGDVLLRIANTAALANYRDSRNQFLTLTAAIARLEAEASGNALVMPSEVVTEAPSIAADEQSLYSAQTGQLASQIAVLQSQLTERQQEVVEMRAKEQSLTRTLDLARQERAITEPLVSTGAASRMELVHLERTVADIDGQVTAIRLSIPRAEAALAEAKQRIDEKVATFRSDAGVELNKRRADLSTISDKIVAERDRVTRTEVRSPVHGVVKELKINTIGGVVLPGQDLVELVPLEDSLLVEAKIRPSDIAFLRPGQPAVVKISAYDYSIYSGLKAKLEQISADSIKEKTRGDNFFRVTLRTAQNHLGSDAHPLPIIPGMTASVEILTGHRTVLDYLLKPIFKARERALHER